MSSNQVDIRIKGTDVSQPAFDRARSNAKQLTRDMSGMGRTIGQVSDVARQLGAVGMADMIGSMELAAMHMGKMNKAAMSSKAAVAGLGVAAVAAGYQIGQALGEFLHAQGFGGLGPWDAAARNAEGMAKLNEEIQGVIIQQIKLKDATLGSAMEEEAVITKKIQELEKRKDLNGEEQKLIFQYNRLLELKAEIASKEEEDKTNKLGQDLAGMSGKMIRSSSFDSKDSIGYSTYTPEQSQKVLAFNRDLDQMLESFKKYNHAKDEVEAFAAKVETQRAKGLKKMHEDMDRAELKTKMTLWSGQLSAAGSLFGSLADLAAAHGKKGFRMAQTLRYGEAIMSTAAGIIRAFADYAWPYCFIPAAAVAAAGAAQIAAISAAKPPQAHGGLDFVPQEQTFLLSRGERVIQPRQNQQLTEFLDNNVSGQSGGGGGDIYLDSERVGRVLYRMSKNGRMRVSSRSLS